MSFFFSSATEKENRRCVCHRRERENAMLDTLYNGFAGLVGTLNDLMYSYVLIILLARGGPLLHHPQQGSSAPPARGVGARGQRKIGRHQGGQCV